MHNNPRSKVLTIQLQNIGIYNFSMQFEIPDVSFLGLNFGVFDLRLGFLAKHYIYIYREGARERQAPG